MKLMIGADPEVFVKNSEARLISAHEFPCGDKYNPRRTRHGAVQVDGMALEFNVRPAKNKKEFVKNVKAVVSDLATIVSKHSPDCYLSFIPYANFGHEYLESVPIQNRVLGCSVDFNAYTGFPNPMPDASKPIRTAAGHVHLGWGRFEESREHYELCRDLVKELDIYLGLPSLKWDGDPHRRELYGKAGSFRPKLYGVEYRVLSNIWADDDDLVGYVFSQTKKCFMNWRKKDLLAPEYGEFARDCIDKDITSWEDKAPKLADFLEIEAF